MNNELKFEGEYSLETMLRRAVEYARPRCHGTAPRWAAVQDVLHYGSTTSALLCKHFGLDPHEEIEGTHPKPEESEEFGAAVNIGARESLLADQNYRMVDWLLSGVGRHWMHWQAEQGKQPTREDVAEAMEVGP